METQNSFLQDKEIKGSIDAILLDKRRIYLVGGIDYKAALEINKTLRALDVINQDPIFIEINSVGGCIQSAFSIVNTMSQLTSQVVTVINGYACSAATLISVAGNLRVICENSVWMAHDMSGGISGDYSQKVIDRVDWIKKNWKQIEDHYKKYTKLTEKQVSEARTGELWLDYKKCEKAGITDYLLVNNKKTNIKQQPTKKAKK